MNRNLCLFFVVCLAVILVKSESTIEVDENGDEYDVKKFHIQGRQLNEGRSQCVVTRRKRATQPKPMYYSDDGINDDVENQNDAFNIKDKEQQGILIYTPTVELSTAIEDGEDDKQDEENSMMNMNEMNENKEGEQLTNSMQESKQNKTEENVEMLGVKQKEEEIDYNNESDSFEIIQLHQLPILNQSQSDGESVAEMTSVISVPGTTPVNNNGIVLVQSVDPPKVNPLTHAVFELVPVLNYGVEEEDNDDEHEPEEEDEDADNDIETANAVGDFDFKEDLTPITTTAIWSTGDDGLNDLFNTYDLQPLKVEKVVKKNRKPLKAIKKKRKSSTKTKRKNKYSNSFRRGLKKSDKKNNNKRRVQSVNSVQRPVRKRGNTTRRRGSHNNKVSVTRDQNNKRKRKKHLKNSISNNKHRNLNNRNKAVIKRNRNKNNGDNSDQDANTITQTMVTTETGNEDDDNNVNCIIIRKDPPPTTARPFWNLLGRSAESVPQASGHFGKRKRINMRFVA